MFMGVIPVNVKQTDKMTYIGQMVYGSCSSGYMVWRGFVSFNVNGETKTACLIFSLMTMVKTGLILTQIAFKTFGQLPLVIAA